MQRLAPVFALLMAVIILASSALAKTCQCIDRGDIKQRLREARTAISVYERELEVIREQERRTGEVITLTEERRKKLQSRVQQALDKLATQSGRIATLAIGKTARMSFCIPEVVNPAASPCMKQSVLTHEAVHQKACMGSLAWNKTLSAYAREEIESYKAEIGFLEEELSKLPCDYKVDRAEVDPSSGWRRTFYTLKCNGPAGDWVYESKLEGAGINS